MNTIFGIGSNWDIDTFTDVDDSFNFIYRAYMDGYIENNSWTFQSINGNSKYAHLTIGGYMDSDFSGDIEWYSQTDSSSTNIEGDGDSANWKLAISSFMVDNAINLLEPEPEDDPTENHGSYNTTNSEYPYVNTEDNVVAYAYFNTGYPFLGVDKYIGEKIELDLKNFRPDVIC